MSRLDPIAQRRAKLLQEIEAGRESMVLLAQGLRKDLALTSLGFTLGQLIGRKGWLRVAGVAALAFSLARPLFARLFRPKR